MKIHVESVTHFGAPRELIFAAVQLNPPVLDEVSANKTFEWRAPDRAQREQDIENILNTLFSESFPKKPDIVVFSEYSVPKQVIDNGDLQILSDRQNAVIIAGSYFDIDKSSSSFRNNLCHIFIPKRPSPLVLCKATKSPKEEDSLLTSNDFPNIARLVWNLSEAASVSISVFLCRDYLMPFQVRSSKDESGQCLTERVSALDWDREGINIAVMNNLDPRLFEAAASFDVRETHGERKLVLLVNSANHHEKLATALLGASKEPDREADVAARLPSSMEGVLIVQTRLWDVAATRKTPDVKETYPISHWSAYSYSRTDSILRPIKKEQNLPQRRGIFHPAFLEAVQRDIVVEFIVAKSTQRVEQAFASGKIKHVTASHVRGIQDIMVRRYVERHMTKGSIPEKLTLPFCTLRDSEFDAAFDISPSSPALKLLIEPKNILKIRGAAVPRLSSAEWGAVHKNILEALDYGTRNREACEIAKGLPDGESIPKLFEPVFSLGYEQIIPIGKVFRNEIREEYVLVSSEDKLGNAATASLEIYINEHLIMDSKIRDIYRISKIEPYASRNPFQFLLRLKCSAFETDDILFAMQQWASNNEIRVGTRSYDLWRHIKRESIEGIVDTKMTESELALLLGVHAIESSASWNLDNQLREKTAEAWQRHMSDFARLGKLGADCQRHLSNFYCNVVLFNIDSPTLEKKRFLENAQQGWQQLFKYFENWSKSLLLDVLELSADSKNEAMGERLRAKLPRQTEAIPTKELLDPPKMFLRFYPELRGITGGNLFTTLRANAPRIQRARNLAAHGGNESAWVKFTRLNDSNWESQFDELEEHVFTLCKLLVEVWKEAIARKLSLE